MPSEATGEPAGTAPGAPGQTATAEAATDKRSPIDRKLALAEARLDALAGDLKAVRASGHLPPARAVSVTWQDRVRNSAWSTRCFALAIVLVLAAIIVAAV